jgi:deoxyguanosine kinase
MADSEFPYNYICVEGNIGAGKTSFCKMIKEEYNCRMILEQFDDNPFLPFFYEDPERYGFTVELFFMTERHKQMQKSLLSRDLFNDFVITDYCFIKTLLFASKTLNEEEYRLFQKLFQVLSQSFPNPDIIVYFHRSTNILMDNIKKRGRGYEGKITEEYLTEVQNAYFNYFRNISSFPVVIVDLNEVDFVTHEDQYEVVKSILKKEYQPGVHRISLHV